MRTFWRRPLSVAVAVFLAGCAGYSGHGLRPGQATEAEVTAAMGAPAMVWPLPDGRRQLAFPRGPAGVHTYMAWFGADGRLESIRNVLAPEVFVEVLPGLGEAEVLRLLGPGEPAWTAHFPARNELVLEWRYYDDWGETARFDVLFDSTTKRVRSTDCRPESSFTRYRTPCSR